MQIIHWRAWLLVVAKCVFASELLLELPSSHHVASDNNYLYVRIHGIVPTENIPQELRIEYKSSATFSKLVQLVPSDGNVQITDDVASVRLSCKYFPYSGFYKLVVYTENGTEIYKELDIITPNIEVITTPASFNTYPDKPIIIHFNAPDVCSDESDENLLRLLLTFCGEDAYCNNENSTNGHHKIYSTTLHKRDLSVYKTELSCQLFGQAGYYGFQLLDDVSNRIVLASTIMKVNWSEHFVFDVHAKSIFPCDGINENGIGVLFQYPSCILNDGDRIRVYAKRRADVASLAPPTTLHYVTEKRVTKGRHSMRFDCELFNEHYVEYCFVYVSRAITGAVIDVRMVCLPTLPPVPAAGWGPWSAWTPCSETCGAGTRTRYRVCNDPSPRYGAAFCEGDSVDTEECGISAVDRWQCLYGGTLVAMAERGETVGEMDPLCRCGCVLHLSRFTTKSLIATSSESCPGRAFWLIQADPGHVVTFKIEYYRLPCISQWVKLRDGESLSSLLLGHLEASQYAHGHKPALEFVSTGIYMLLEFNSNELLTSTKECTSEIMAYATQIVAPKLNHTNPEADHYTIRVGDKFSLAYIAAFSFIGLILFLSGILGSQYLLRYRKYELAEDLESLVDTPGSEEFLSLQARSISNGTLLSEVISMVRLKSKEISEKSTEIDFENSSKNFTQMTSGEGQANHVDNCKQQMLTVKNEALIATDSPKISHERLHNDNENSQSTDKILEIKLTSGYYSPSAGKISVAKIKSMNHKENKEKINREKVLSEPGSELSLSNADLEMEMDYYDYNVINAGAIPGSYLGMDPAFLVWIPPLMNGDSPDSVENHYEEILPRDYSISPGSNKESPEEENSIKKLNVIKKCNDIINKSIDFKTDSNILEEILPIKQLPLKEKLTNTEPIHVHHIATPKTSIKEQVGKKTNDSKWLDDIQYVDDDEVETDFNGTNVCDNRCKDICNYKVKQ